MLMSTTHRSLLCLFLIVLTHECCLCAPTFPRYCGPAPGTAWAVPQPGQHYTVQLVQVVVRHGARIPLNHWPNFTGKWNCSDITSLGISDESTDDVIPTPGRFYREQNIEDHQVNPGNCYGRQLTNKGYNQHLSLGDAFRKTYVDALHFLPESLNGTDLFIRWDADLRTKFSAHGFINGLYPPSASQGQTEVVDTWTMDKTYDDMFPNTNLCPIIKEYDKQVTSDKLYLQNYAQWVQPILDSLKGPMQWNDIDFDTLFDCAMSTYCHNLELPAAITNEVLEKIYVAQNRMRNLYLAMPTRLERVQAGVGLLIGEILDSLQEHIMQGTKSSKLELYSAHDSTMDHLMTAFGAYLTDQKGEWPPFASYIAFETLKNDNGAYFVRMLFNGEEKVIADPACDNSVYCKFESFLQVAKQFRPSLDQCIYSSTPQ
eukprot:TRINITY_DN7147_c0_g1_i2.p1 TRINITY_DN7147_c0_g1~~TRINITY_DN7147_c0_g1_i2.p1  ORF type:complete len:436 (-),score=98.54 TRINITY_DN7147_c0_g1_i2:37-1323(-)